MVTIVATKGAANANCYVTVGEADEFFTSIYGTDEWPSLNADAKTQLLITASQTIDDMPHRYKSIVVTQGLIFPICNTSVDSTDDGFAAAKKATFWQALHLLRNHDSIEEARTNKIQGVRQEVISKIQKTMTGHNPFANYHPRALKLMGPFVDFNFVIRRG